MTRETIDLTPTWAQIMPALIAALQHGTREGRTMATEELDRLARAVDSSNARAKQEAPKAAARSEALDTARACLGAFPPADLDRQKSGAAWRDTARDLRDTLAALVASMEEGAGQ